MYSTVRIWTDKFDEVDYVHFKQMEKGESERSSLLVYVTMFRLALDHPHQDGITEHDVQVERETETTNRRQNCYN